MATVFLATDLKHDREVAIKVLHPELAANLGPERFDREIKFAAKLQHPNILGLYDSGEAAGLLYYVMPFVHGESLRDRLTREQMLPVDLAIHIALEVADERMMEQIQPRMAKVIDAFQVYLRELRKSDLEGSAGIYRLKEELRRRVNVAIFPAQVHSILFKEILVQ